jgi:hypothetical protein
MHLVRGRGMRNGKFSAAPAVPSTTSSPAMRVPWRVGSRSPGDHRDHGAKYGYRAQVIP